MLTNRSANHAYDEDILALWNPSLGDNQRHPCPKCSPERKSVHRNERVLSLSRGDRGIIFLCHHCSFEGLIPDNPSRPHTPSSPRKYMSEPARLTPLPIEENRTLSEAAVAWFASRGISEQTCLDMSVWSAPAGRSDDVIRFPYTTGGNVYALKMRSYPEKRFHCQGAPATFFGIDQVVPGEDLIIAEGECDQLSIREAGHKSAVSVPNGAPVQVSDRKIDPENDRKYACVWSARKQLEEAKRIIIACDSDAPGQALAEELARRIGKARCWRVEWPEDCKDANDVLMKHGKDKLEEILDNPTPWPIQGVYDADHYRGDVVSLFSGGAASGESTGFPNVDEIFTVMPGHLNLVTGVPGSGKTAWVNAVMVNISKNLGWRWAVQSSEIDPPVHIGMLAALYAEKSFFHAGSRMTDVELEASIDWVNNHFTFLTSDETAGVPDTIDRLSTAVLRYGIQGYCIDPVSYLRRSDSQGDSSESVGAMLEAFKSFSQSHSAVGFLVAHPNKMVQNMDGSIQVPKGYNVSGSSHYYNRPDCGITIHRPADARDETQVHIWKMRYSWVGQEGMRSLFFDLETGRYSDQPFPYAGQKTIYSGWNPENEFDAATPTENKVPF